jgi:Tfp pilus assembly protein PilV
VTKVRALLARARARHAVRSDAGITLAEVLVAMLIFALISTGFIATSISVISVTRDSRAREVAANLAAEEIDLARDAEDLFDLVDATRSVSLNGDTFSVRRTTSWVTNPDQDFSCGGAGGIGAAAGGTLRYKRVNVEVTWDNMREGARAVRSDTVINPAAKINDPTLGTIIVSVLNGAGTGSEGIPVSTSPSAGSVIKPTDEQGCTYVLKVSPKSYAVSISKTGYVDAKQQSTSSQTVSVVAGQSTTVGFQYDRAAAYTARLASTAPAGTTVRVPTNLKTTFANTYGLFNRTADSGSGTTQRFDLHPFSQGYQAYAGTCDSADPMLWPDQAVAGGTLHGERLPAVAAPPGGATTIDVPMGLVAITGGSGGSYLKAVSQNPTAAELPRCATAETLTFGNVLGGGTTVIALPYGTWKLYRGTTAGTQNTAAAAGSLSFPAPAVPERSSVAADGTVTLDPRVVVAP